MLAMLFALQAAPQTGTMVLEAKDFDLARVAKVEAGCGDPNLGDEIIVCARLNLVPRLADLEDLEAIYGPKPFRPSVGVAGGEASARVEQRGVISGQSAPALMFDFKLPF